MEEKKYTSADNLQLFWKFIKYIVFAKINSDVGKAKIELEEQIKALPHYTAGNGIQIIDGVISVVPTEQPNTEI